VVKENLNTVKQIDANILDEVDEVKMEFQRQAKRCRGQLCIDATSGITAKEVLISNLSSFATTPLLLTSPAATN